MWSGLSSNLLFREFLGLWKCFNCRARFVSTNFIVCEGGREVKAKGEESGKSGNREKVERWKMMNGGVMVLLRAKLKVRRGERGKYVRKMIGERHEDGRGWKIRGCLQIVIYKRRFPRTRPPRNEAYAGSSHDSFVYNYRGRHWRIISKGDSNSRFCCFSRATIDPTLS